MPPIWIEPGACYRDPPRAVARYGSCRFRVRFACVWRQECKRRSIQVPEQSLSPGSVIMRLASCLIPDPTGNVDCYEICMGHLQRPEKSPKEARGRTRGMAALHGYSSTSGQWVRGVSSATQLLLLRRFHAPKFRVWRRPASSQPMRARSSSGSSTPKSLSRAGLRDCEASRYGNSRCDDPPCGPPR